MKKEDIKDYIEKNGGITLDEKGDLFTKKEGFIVSVFGKEYQTNDLEKATNKLLEYSKKGCICGVWLDGGVYYVDVNEHYTDRELAELEGLDNKQLAIFDLKKGESIELIQNDFILYEYNKAVDDLVAVGFYDSLKELAEKTNIKYKTACNWTIKNYNFNLDNISDYQLINGKFAIIKY